MFLFPSIFSYKTTFIFFFSYLSNCFSIYMEKLFYICGKVFLYIWKKQNKEYFQNNIVYAKTFKE